MFINVISWDMKFRNLSAYLVQKLIPDWPNAVALLAKKKTSVLKKVMIFPAVTEDCYPTNATDVVCACIMKGFRSIRPLWCFFWS